MSGRPRVLDELEIELARAIAADAAGARGGRRPAAVVLILATVLLVAGGAAAAVLVLRGTIDPARERDLGRAQTPVGGSGHIAVVAADPRGGPDWALRVSRTQDGELCSAVGQLVDGRFGVVGLDGMFRELPDRGIDTCGVSPHGGPPMIGARVFDGLHAANARTAVSGLAGAGAAAVEVRPRGGGVMPAKLGPDGAFLVVLAGRLADARPVVTVHGAGGVRRITLAGAAWDEVADPDGLTAWNESFSGEPRGRACAQFARVRPPGGTDADLVGSVPVACGSLRRAPAFWVVRRFSPPADPAFVHRWPLASRTVVYGAARPGVRRVEVTWRGGRLRLAPLSRPAGARPGERVAVRGLLAVLPGSADPARVKVTLVAADGSRTTRSGPAALYDEPPVDRGALRRGGRGARSSGRLVTGRLAHLGPQPPARPAPADPVGKPPVVPGSVALSPPVADRGGGAAWAVQTWRSGRLHRIPAMRCAQLGRVVGGTFGRLDALGRLTPMEPDPGAWCAPGTPSLAVASVYLDDPFSYDARPARVVVWGAAPAWVRTVTLLGPAGTAALHPAGRGRAFVHLLAPGTDPARYRVRFAGPGQETIRPLGGPSPRGPKPARSLGVVARAPDPDGGPPWAAVAVTDGRMRCTTLGRLVAGRLSRIAGRDGLLLPVRPALGAMFGGTCTGPGNPLTPRRPFAVAVSDAQTLGLGDALESPGRIARRTLPGRTAITGWARAGVSDITIETSRDVRTLRPGAGGAFLAVYDGDLRLGDIRITARLLDGSTVTRVLPHAAS